MSTKIFSLHPRLFIFICQIFLVPLSSVSLNLLEKKSSSQATSLWIPHGIIFHNGIYFPFFFLLPFFGSLELEATQIFHNLKRNPMSHFCVCLNCKYTHTHIKGLIYFFGAFMQHLVASRMSDITRWFCPNWDAPKKRKKNNGFLLYNQVS